MRALASPAPRPRSVDLTPRHYAGGVSRLKKPLQVVHVVPALFDGVEGILGGAERYAVELARHMAVVVPTTLLSFGATPRDELVDGLRLKVLSHPMYIRGQRSNPIHGGLFRELSRATVVHCHQKHVVTSSLAALVCRLTGKRVYVTDLGGGGWDISGYISTDGWYHGHLHISQYSRRIYGQENNSRAHVISGGVDSAKFTPLVDSSKEGGPVLFVGRLLPHKGVNYLIEALPDGVRLEIIGQVYEAGFFQQLQELAAGKEVTFLQTCTDQQLLAAYRRACCIVLPSVYCDLYGKETKVPELLGQTLLEGMACGIPAICTEVASMPEIVVNGVTGFVVPPNDPAALSEKLRWVVQYPSEARAMGRGGRERVMQQFSWPAVVQHCLEIYQS